MNTSEQINELASALMHFQSAMGPVAENSKNPQFRSSYADLGAIISAIQPALLDNGLSFVQMLGTPSVDMGGPTIALTTRIMHFSGQWLEDTFVMPIPSDMKGPNIMQVAGSGISYARRYALASAFGIYTGDDTDGYQPPRKARSDSRGTEGPQAQAQRERPTAASVNGNGQTAMLKKLHALGGEVYGPDWDDKRAEFCATFGVESSRDLSQEQVQKLIDGMMKRVNG